ncbi:SH3-like domain-containing protein [Mycobacterium servetii]|uniref:nitrile hydratase n=1 Tax=Mycobacterium servetii TaxID=3237418 RepID=A0ABV4BV43_9MYCO
MSNAAEREKQLALVSRLKATYPEIPEWPTPDMITSDRYWAYLKPNQDQGGQLNVAEPFLDKEEEQWELMTYVLCEVLGWGGVWVSEERRRTADVDVGLPIYLGLPYYARWLWSVGKILLEKEYVTWGELTDRLAEVQARYAGGLNGRLPKAQPKFQGNGPKVKRNRNHIEALGKGDPGMYAGKAGKAGFKVGDRVRVRELPAMFYTRTPEYLRGAEGVIAEVAYESPAPEDETWGREDVKPEWFYIVRFKQADLWDSYFGHANDTLQTEIPERWLHAAG